MNTFIEKLCAAGYHDLNRRLVDLSGEVVTESLVPHLPGFLYGQAVAARGGSVN
jgi:hypothetical protein